MRDRKSPYCPHCGRNMIFEDTVCPYCGEPVRIPFRKGRPQAQPPVSARGTSGEVLHSSDPEKYTKKKSGKKLALVIGLLVVFSGPLLTLLGGIVDITLDMMDSFSNSSQEAVQVQPEETADWTRPEYYTLPQEEYDRLDAGVIWEDPEQWDALCEGLSRKEQKAMDALGQDLRWSTLSRTQAMQIIREEGCSQETGEALLEMLNIDWNTQALKSVLGYLRGGAYTPADLQRQLEYEGFTEEQIGYAIENCGADWDRQLELELEESLHFGTYSRENMISHLENKGATHDRAVELVDGSGADWYEQAVRCAGDYVEYMDMDREELYAQLQYEQFTEDQIQYALDVLDME